MEKVIYQFNNHCIDKTLIFDMDETLIHCVDDIDAENPEVVLPIKFPDEEELVYVINLTLTFLIRLALT